MYIGSSVNLLHREDQHLCELRNNRHKNPKLQAHYNKYGKDDLIFTELYLCDNNDLLEAEQFFINEYKPWFNVSEIAGHSNLGRTLSEEARNNMSKAQLGKKRNLSEEDRLRRAERIKPYMFQKGHKQSAETLEKQRLAKLGNKIMLGKKLSEETKRKIGEKSKGNKYRQGKVPWNKGMKFK